MSIYFTGTMGNDTLKARLSQDGQLLIGLAGDDVLDASLARGSADLLGGSGNDTYTLGRYSMALINDSSGWDTVHLPYTKSYLTYNRTPVHFIVDETNYLVAFESTSTLFIRNFNGSGAIENIVLQDGTNLSVNGLIDAIGRSELQYTSLSNMFSPADKAVLESTLASYDKFTGFEAVSAANPAQPWFNDSVYMQNKASSMGGVNLDVLNMQFTDAFFPGRDGHYIHFIQYGQWEDVSPIATFDAGYYYTSKAADFNNISISQVSTAQAQEMKEAIHNAGMTAWSHYQHYGTREGIDASASFDTSAYMEAKLALMKKDDPGYTMNKLFAAFEGAGLSAAAHYEAYGKGEGLTAVSVPTPVTPALFIAEQLDANQAGLFVYESDYYLFGNDANASFDPDVDIAVTLAGLSDADAASMTTGIFI